MCASEEHAHNGLASVGWPIRYAVGATRAARLNTRTTDSPARVANPEIWGHMFALMRACSQMRTGRERGQIKEEFPDWPPSGGESVVRMFPPCATTDSPRGGQSGNSSLIWGHARRPVRMRGAVRTTDSPRGVVLLIWGASARASEEHAQAAGVAPNQENFRIGHPRGEVRCAHVPQMRTSRRAWPQIKKFPDWPPRGESVVRMFLRCAQAAERGPKSKRNFRIGHPRGESVVRMFLRCPQAAERGPKSKRNFRIGHPQGAAHTARPFRNCFAPRSVLRVVFKRRFGALRYCR